MAERVNIVDKWGDTQSIDMSELDAALEKGFHLETPEEFRKRRLQEEYGTGSDELKAGALGAARSLSFGLSDVAAKNLGKAQDVKLLGEANPKATIAGEVGGTIASLALPVPKGGGVLSTGARAVTAPTRAVANLGLKTTQGVSKLLPAGKGLAGKLISGAGAAAVGGALEGAIYGAAKSVSEDALGNTDLTAESFLSEVGAGALLGGASAGAASVAFDAINIGVAKGAQKISDKMERAGVSNVSEAIEQFSDDQALYTAFGRQKRAFDVVENKGWTKKAANYIKDDIGLKAGDSTASVSRRLAEKRDLIGRKLGDTVEQADAFAAATGAKRVNATKTAERLRKLADDYKGTESPFGKALNDLADDVGSLGDDISFAAARRQRAAIQKRINYNVEAKGKAEVMRKAASVYNDVIDEAIEPVIKKLDDAGRSPLAGTKAKSYKNLREEFALVSDLDDFAQKRVSGNRALRSISMSDMQMAQVGGIVQGLKGGVTDGTIGGLALAGVNKAYRTFGSAIAATEGDRLAQYVARLEKSNRRTKKGVSEAVAAALSGTARNARRTTSASISSAVGIEDAKGRLLRPVAPSAVILSTSFGDKKDKPKNVRQAAKKRASELSALTADPVELSKRISAATGPLSDAAPKTAAKATESLVKTVQFLHDKAPKRPTGSDIQLGLDDWEPSDQESYKFARYVQAAVDPLSVVRGAATGDLSAEGVETLKELFPEIHKMTKEQVFAQAAELQERIGFDRLAGLSLLLDIPLHPLLEGEAIARSQEGWNVKPNKGQGPDGMRLSGLDKIDLSQDTMTESQKLEARRT